MGRLNPNFKRLKGPTNWLSFRHRQPVAIASLSPSHAVLFDATIMIIDQPAATA